VAPFMLSKGGGGFILAVKEPAWVLRIGSQYNHRKDAIKAVQLSRKLDNPHELTFALMSTVNESCTVGVSLNACSV